MSVFLMILKVAGLVILSLVGLVLLILLLVLFVPIRYRMEGYYTGEEYSAGLKASWLLHIVSYKFFYPVEDKNGLYIFVINTSKSHKDSGEEAFEKTVTVVEEKPEAVQKENLTNEEKTVTENEVEAEKSETSGFEDIITNEDAPLKKKEKRQKKKREPKKPFKKDNLCGKIKKYFEIVQTDDFKKGYELCKIQISKILKHIFPKKWEIRGSAGFEDPADTGKLCAVIGMLYPWMHEHIKVTGNFENSEINLDAYGRGRIFVIVLLLIFIKVYFDKNLKKLIAKFKNV